MSGPCWSTVNPGLVALFTELAMPASGLQSPAWAAAWRDRPQKAAPVTGPLKGVTLTLRIASVVGIGDDDRRMVEVPTSDPPTIFDGELQETIYGLRRVTLNLQCRSNESTDAQWAMSVLERIRTRIRRTRSIDALLALNVGFVRAMQALDISAKQDQHTQSRASMDLILTMVASDEDPIPTGWIQTLDISSRIQDVSGATLPVPPNFDHFTVTKP